MPTMMEKAQGSAPAIMSSQLQPQPRLAQSSEPRNLWAFSAAVFCWTLLVVSFFTLLFHVNGMIPTLLFRAQMNAMGSSQAARELAQQTVAQGSVPGSDLYFASNSNIIVLRNSLVEVTLATNGQVLRIQYGGVSNFLSDSQHNNLYGIKIDPKTKRPTLDGIPMTNADLEELDYYASGAISNRGYWDVTYTSGQVSSLEVILFTSFRRLSSPINKDHLELAFYRPYRGTGLPANLELRMILKSKDPGFYYYMVVSRSASLPQGTLGEFRLVYKMNPDICTYAAATDNLQREMPSLQDRTSPRSGQLFFPEARLLLNPEKRQFKGSVDDKYHFAISSKDDLVKGWITNSTYPLGMWIISPKRMESLGGGPLKQELCLQTGPIMLQKLHGLHYGTPAITLRGNYQKVFGPFRVHFNRAAHPSKPSTSGLWNAAKIRAAQEEKLWPYSFVTHPAYTPAAKRGQVTGRIIIQYPFKRSISSTGGWMGLADYGPAGAWQDKVQGYQFWSRVNGAGQFTLASVAPGSYGLYGFFQGLLGDFLYQKVLVVKAGQHLNLGTIVWKADPKRGSTVWEIGTPDRSANEFFVPPLVTTNYHYPFNQGIKSLRYRNYGSWLAYARTYPTYDPVYTIGKSMPAKDWFFVHPLRLTGRVKTKATTRRISFNLAKVATWGYTLRVSLAAAKWSLLAIRVNNPYQNPYYLKLETYPAPDDNSMIRASEHGQYRAYKLSLPKKLFKIGMNNIYITHANVTKLPVMVMYDYLRLEAF